MKFKGKTALITGGASGIGRALGEKLAQRGATVILADLNGPAAVEAAKALSFKGFQVGGASLDVTNAEAFEEEVRKVHRDHGRLDYLFNNAGISMAAEVRYLTLEDWNRILDVNLKGVIHGIHAAYPVMIRQGAGHIVNTASIAGLTPFPLSVAYTAAKHAVTGLSLGMRAEAESLGVKVSVVCPGFIDTPMRKSIKSVNINKEAGEKNMPFHYYPVARCAEDILRGVLRNKAIITITPEADVIWGIYRLSPELFSWVSGLAVKKSRALTEKDKD